MIKEFAINDFQKCCEVFMQTFNSPPWNDQFTIETAGIYLQELVDNKRFVGYTLWVDELLIGAAFCHMRYNWRGDEFCLDIIYISPDYQGKGYGSVILDAVEKSAKENNCMNITLSTSANAPACKLYKKFGFDKVPDDWWVMHKSVK